MQSVNPIVAYEEDKAEKRAFSERLPYVRNEGFRTPAKALPLSLIEQIQDGEYKMVPPARLELALPKEPDFESGASTNSTTGARRNDVLGSY